PDASERYTCRVTMASPIARSGGSTEIQVGSVICLVGEGGGGRRVQRPLSLPGQDGTPALLRAAVAGVQPLVGGVVRLVQHVVVVVHQLLAPGDVADGIDENATILLHRLAVRVARVVDVLGDAPARTRVDRVTRVQAEQERVMPLALLE